MNRTPLLPVQATRARLLQTLDRVLKPLEAPLEKLFGSDYNPMYQSGTLAVFGLLVMIVTGVVLFLFYSIEDPYNAVRAIHYDVPGGLLLRSLHRISADLAIVAALVHAARIALQGRVYGPRALAWISGLFLVALFLLCGWTGYVMLWDAHGLVYARAALQTFDLFPLFSEPLERMVSGIVPAGNSFFFFFLFLHVALPLGAAAALWLHVSRLARPKLLPSRRFMVATVVLLVIAAWLRPAPMGEMADPLALSTYFEFDLWYGWWVVLVHKLGPLNALLVSVTITVILVAMPWILRPRPVATTGDKLPTIITSYVNEKTCTGCSTCYEDCPYEAISMVRRAEPSPLSEIVARVDPSLCVGCGICAGSCAPMGVGPVGRGGREQISAIRHYLMTHTPPPQTTAIFACQSGAGADPVVAAQPGVQVFDVGCAGSVHTSVMEFALRGGFSSVLIAACHHRDAPFRDGHRLLAERIYAGREAELMPRVDRQRIGLSERARTDVAGLLHDLEQLRQAAAGRGASAAESVAELEIETECEPVPAQEVL